MLKLKKSNNQITRVGSSTVDILLILELIENLLQGQNGGPWEET